MKSSSKSDLSVCDSKWRGKKLSSYAQRSVTMQTNDVLFAVAGYYRRPSIPEPALPMGSKVCIFSGTKNNFSGTKINFSRTKNNFSGTKNNISGTKINFSATKINFSRIKILFSATKIIFSPTNIIFSGTKIILVPLKIQTFEPNGTPYLMLLLHAIILELFSADYTCHYFAEIDYINKKYENNNNSYY